MRNIIKLIIALSVILGSYFLGYYQAEERHSAQFKEMNDKLSIRQLSIQQLKDSISRINKRMYYISTQAKDTSKLKVAISNK